MSPTEEEYIQIWQVASGCVARPGTYTKADIEKYLPRVLEEHKFVRDGSSARKAVREIWDHRGEPYAIAYATAVCLENNILTIPYLKGVLTGAPTCDSIIDISPRPEAGATVPTQLLATVPTETVPQLVRTSNPLSVSLQANNPSAVSNLNQKHYNDLRSSGLSDDTIKSAGFYSADTKQVAEILGFNTRCGGMAIPYGSLHAKDRFIRVKPDTPFLDRYGKPSKYLSRKGAGNRLYIPPNVTQEMLQDFKTPLWITEGEKKALAGAQQGLCCIAVPGVWSWKGKFEGKSFPIKDLDLIEWKGRSVFLVFDSDLRENREVARALYQLAKELERRRSDVRKVDMPSGPRGAKVGLDDFLLGHSVETLCVIKPTPVMPPEFQYLLIEPVSEFIHRELPNREAIIDKGILFPKSKLGLTGPGKKGKSVLAQNMMFCLTCGANFLDQFHIPTRRKVLYVQAEISEHSMQDRLRKMFSQDGIIEAEFNKCYAITAHSLKIDKDGGYSILRSLIDQTEPEVLILDPLYKMHSVSENKPEEIKVIFDRFDEIIGLYGISIVLVHHHRKLFEGNGSDIGQLARGSLFSDWVDGQIVMKSLPDGPEDIKRVEVGFVLRNAEEPHSITMSLNKETIWWEPELPGYVDMQEREKIIKIAEDLWGHGEDISASTVSKKISVSKPTASQLLQKLPENEWEKVRGPRNSIIYKKIVKLDGKQSEIPY